jgi:hypothetical protein
MKRACVRSPDRFQITNMYATTSLLGAATTSGSNSPGKAASASSRRQSTTQCSDNVVEGKCEEDPADHRAYLLVG